MPSKTKAKKSKHGGPREGAGRKPATALRCPMCVILAQQLALAGEREQRLMKQLERQSGQIGQVIENRFETVRVRTKDLPPPDRPAMPIEQLADVEAVNDQEFVEAVSGMTH